MATLVRRYTAGEDLAEGDAVYISGDTTVKKAGGAASDWGIGLADHAVLAGEPVDVVVYGPKKGITDNALVAGDSVQPGSTAGHVKAFSGDASLGRAEQAASAGGGVSIFVTAALKASAGGVTDHSQLTGVTEAQHHSHEGAHVYGPSGQSVGRYQILTWDGEIYDDNGLHSAGNPTRLTAQVAGVYVIWANIYWDTTNINGDRRLSIQKNGSWAAKIARTKLSPAGYDMQEVVCIDQLNAGDYLEIEADQTSGATLDVTAWSFAMHLLR